MNPSQSPLKQYFLSLTCSPTEIPNSVIYLPYIPVEDSQDETQRSQEGHQLALSPAPNPGLLLFEFVESHGRRCPVRMLQSDADQ